VWDNNFAEGKRRSVKSVKSVWLKSFAEGKRRSVRSVWDTEQWTENVSVMSKRWHYWHELSVKC